MSRVCNRGVTRLVFILKHVVVKVPRFTCKWEHFIKGILANISESNTWKYNSGKYEKGTSDLLCPVVWCSWGGWVLVMKKVDRCLQYDEWDKWDISEHRKHFEGDDTVSNYGVLNNRLVKIDYGQLK